MAVEASASGVSEAVTRLAELGRIRDSDNSGEVRQLWKRLRELEIEQVGLQDKLSDLKKQLKDSDQEMVRRAKTSYTQVTEKMASVRQSLENAQKKVVELDQNLQRLQKQLRAPSSSGLGALQRRAEILRAAADVFGGAVERYKAGLRAKVAASATKLFKLMTTEKEDYASLAIGENYGLSIIHTDGKAEEARSAGAEHIVALALMGALQQNAPLRGPIVMDSPFGRLDEGHTKNVVKALPQMTEQVLLLVYESEVGRSEVRKCLGTKLVCEYELQRESARRTSIRKVR